MIYLLPKDIEKLGRAGAQVAGSHGALQKSKSGTQLVPNPQGRWTGSVEGGCKEWGDFLVSKLMLPGHWFVFASLGVVPYAVSSDVIHVLPEAGVCFVKAKLCCGKQKAWLLSHISLWTGPWPTMVVIDRNLLRSQSTVVLICPISWRVTRLTCY